MYNSDKTTAVTFIAFYKKSVLLQWNYLSFTVWTPHAYLPNPPAFTAYIIWRQLPPSLHLACL